MRRIISLLVIARLVQRLINGSRQPGGFHQGRGPGRGSGTPGRSKQPAASGLDEPPQGGAPTARDEEPPQGGAAQARPSTAPDKQGNNDNSGQSG